MQVRAEAVRATVDSLINCLLKSGMSCGLAESLISPISRGEPAHYMSTLYQLGEDSQVISCLLKVMATIQAKPKNLVPKPRHEQKRSGS